MNPDVSLPSGIHRTKCRNSRAQWNTTRRNWRTWDFSGDRYLSLHTHIKKATSWLFLTQCWSSHFCLCLPEQTNGGEEHGADADQRQSGGRAAEGKRHKGPTGDVQETGIQPTATMSSTFNNRWLSCVLITCYLSAQVVELQNRLSEESKKADKMEFEYKRVKEKVDSLQKEKDVIMIRFTIWENVLWRNTPPNMLLVLFLTVWHWHMRRWQVRSKLRRLDACWHIEVHYIRPCAVPFCHIAFFSRKVHHSLVIPLYSACGQRETLWRRRLRSSTVSRPRRDSSPQVEQLGVI